MFGCPSSARLPRAAFERTPSATAALHNYGLTMTNLAPGFAPGFAPFAPGFAPGVRLSPTRLPRAALERTPFGYRGLAPT
jgi:hypothetical protein